MAVSIKTKLDPWMVRYPLKMSSAQCVRGAFLSYLPFSISVFVSLTCLAVSVPSSEDNTDLTLDSTNTQCETYIDI